MRSDLFRPQLETELQRDADALLGLLRKHGPWNPARDTKLDALHELVTESYPDRKIIVFSQFADTVRYLERELQSRGVGALAGVTGDSQTPRPWPGGSARSATTGGETWRKTGNCGC